MKSRSNIATHKPGETSTNPNGAYEDDTSSRIIYADWNIGMASHTVQYYSIEAVSKSLSYIYIYVYTGARASTIGKLHS